MIMINGVAFSEEEAALKFMGYENNPLHILRKRLNECKESDEPRYLNGFKIQWCIENDNTDKSEIHYKLYNKHVLKYCNNELLHTYSESFFKESHKDIYLKLLKNE